MPQAAIDLHVHTALSPCGDERMRPPEILLTAERLGISVLGIVDHSTAGNAGAIMEAAAAFAVRVFVGVEVESAEGVHLLGLFDSAEAAMTMDAEVAEHLPGLTNRPEILGEQHLLDAWGEVVGIEQRLLIAATDRTVEQLADSIHACGGMALPAHVDRTAHGLFPMLGFVPPRLQVELFEVSRHLDLTEARRRWPELPLLTSSDAHQLDALGQAVTWIPEELAWAPLGARDWGQAVAEVLRARS
ncbi:MAG TPA: PHP domain-containing protein [Armatimonadota bacterium]|jgi:hypothetical protein